MKTMNAAVLHAPGDLRVEKVPVPNLNKNDVLVQVAACGVCGSDVPRVLRTGTYHFPTIPGHEFSGVVVETGDEAKNLLGKAVAVIPLIPCKECDYCSIGEYAQCENYDFLGSRNDGGFAQFVRVPAENVVILPPSVEVYGAAMLEPITVALHAVERLNLRYGETVAVFGLGAIGNFIAQWAQAMGAKVVAIDIDPEKTRIASEVGIKSTICSKNANLDDFINDYTNGRGVDLAFDASGANIAIRQALKILRKFGRLGLLGRPEKPTILENEDFEKILRWPINYNGRLEL